MMDDFASKLLAEEADLERKLAAVRAMKEAYGIGGKAAKAGAAVGGTRPARNTADRMDKFGSYGQHIIDMSTKLLPGSARQPMMTRLLVEQLAALGVEVRGENKVNALSALLARSSKIKGHGRAGWTLADEQDGTLYPASLINHITTDEFSSLLKAGGANANEPPNGEPEDGSETALDAQQKETTEW